MSYKVFAPDGGKGNTQLFGGEPISKADARMEVIGDLDELNCLFGIIGELDLIQKQLMLVSVYLASPTDKLNKTIAKQIPQFEKECNEGWDKLPPLKNFVLPFGNKRGGFLNLARAVCRRTERHMVALAASQPIDELVILYMNRLSDWLFVQARLVSLEEGFDEKIIDLSEL